MDIIGKRTEPGIGGHWVLIPGTFEMGRRWKRARGERRPVAAPSALLGLVLCKLSALNDVSHDA